MAIERSEYEGRVERLRRALREEGLDALVVTAPENICYLSGYWTPGYHVFQALVVPMRSDPFLVLRNIEVGNAKRKSSLDRLYPIDNLDRAVDFFLEACRSEGLVRGAVGVEVDGARQTITRLDLLQAGLSDVTWKPSLDLVERFRAVKSQGEIELVRSAVRMAEAALLAGARSLAAAHTDSDVAAAVHAELARTGSEFTGSPPYIVAGKASGETHALHANRPFERTEHVWMEVSASVQRYHGAVSRVGAVEVTPEVRRCSDASAAAVRAMVGAMRPGVTSGQVDAAGRAAVEAYGLGSCWRNRAAYSLGLSFPPGLGEGHIIDLKPNDPRPLEAGMVFHLIPILKVPDLGAIGCTETVLVTPPGGERLGTLPLEPLQPGNPS